MIKEARVYNREKTASLRSGAWKTEQLHIKNMKLEHPLTLYTKTNLKWIKDPNIQMDTIKLLEKNIEGILFDINHSKIFLTHLLELRK